MDVAWFEDTARFAAPTPVSAAKLHVLQLEPIRERLGPRWPRLSTLVHKLFEKSFSRAQGPRDHFMLVGELSYVATFHGLSPDEAALACAAVAKEVCELLFGEDSEQIVVRSIIGTVPGPIRDLRPPEAVLIATLLEKTGKETITTSQDSRDASLGWLSRAHEHAARLKHTIGFHPAWDIARQKSQWLLLAMETKYPHPHGPTGVERALGPGEAVADMEISLLRAAAAYGFRIAAAQQMGAIAVGVACATLCRPASRQAYLQALKSARLSPASPLLLKIEQIPEGMPLGRLGELAAILAQPGARVLLEFEQARAIPPLDIRLGVAGIGAALPEHCEKDDARLSARQLIARAPEQKAFAFVEGLDTAELMETATASGLKFGAGAAFGAMALSGLETVPKLPLHP